MYYERTVLNFVGSIYYAAADSRLGLCPVPARKHHYNRTAQPRLLSFLLVPLYVCQSGFAQSPHLTDGGVVNAASYAPVGVSAAGSVVSIFGSQLADGLVLASASPLPTSINGTEVLMNGILAPLFFVAPGQINAQIPWETRSAQRTDVQVRIHGTTSATVTILRQPTTPGIFAMNAQGNGQGAVLIANTASLAAPRGAFPNSRPAKIGEYVSIFATALGPVAPEPKSGTPAPANPLSTTVTKPVVNIGGVKAEVSFSGLAPNLIGVYQINAKVPTVGSGDALPLTLEINGMQSNTISIAVATEDWQIGNGRMTGINFSGNIPAADQEILTQLINEAYPRLQRFLGDPPDTFTLNIDVCGWSFDGNTHSICIGYLPSMPTVNLGGFAYMFYTEFSRFFWISDRWRNVDGLPNWLSEAIGDFSATQVFRMLIDEKMRNYDPTMLITASDYDILSLGGKEVIGGTSGKAWKGTDAGIVISQASAMELLITLATTQSVALKGSWSDYTAFKDLKTELYRITNAKQDGPSYDDFLGAVSRIFQHPIDGQKPVDWLQAQPVTYTKGTPGTYVYVFPDTGVNPSNFEVCAFTRTNKERAPGILEEVPITKGIIKARVYSASGLVREFSFDLSAKDRWGRPQFLWPLDIPFVPGAYRIVSSGTINGTEMKSSDSYFAKVDPEKIEITTGRLLSLLILIGLNPDGSVSQKPFAEISGGKLLANANGSAVWQADATTIPASASVNGRTLSLPLPYSRVALIQNP